MLALTFVNPSDFDKVRQDDKVSILGLDEMTPNQPLTIKLDHADGTSESFEVNHSYNKAQIGWVGAGSALNKIREEFA
jgi:aconitate hydratase